MSENNNGGTGQGGVDWQREINDTVTPMELLRQLVAALEKLETEGAAIGEWVAGICIVQNGVEFPRVVTGRGSALKLGIARLELSALSDDANRREEGGSGA